MDITVNDILNITKGTLVYGNAAQICEDFARNTEEIKTGDVFIGFKGETRDGSILYKEALIKGAKGCIINKGANEKIEHIDDKFVIEVEDTVEAIQKIAKFKRSKYDIPVIAITGSVGKTSTKDMIASVLEEKFNVLKTEGNMNNHIGLPLTILKLKDHTAMVVEMGMNHLGEIRVLTNIAKPTIAVITNVGTAHIGNLGSRENILKAKLEIIEGLVEGGKVVINNDNDLLYKWWNENKENKRIITYGIHSEGNNNANEIIYNENSSIYKLNGKEQIEVPVVGEAFIYNSLAAVSVGKELGIDITKIKEGIKKVKLTQMRLDVKQSPKGYTVINDCYNANYDSMKAALEYLNTSVGNRKIAVLGDMLELGEYSKELHEKVGQEVVNNKVDILITVGKEAKSIGNVAKKEQIQVYECNTNDEAKEELNKILRPKDVVLVKASNSMNFKEIVTYIL